LEAFMAVIIGVDPHNATHSAVAISGGEDELGRKKVCAGGTQAEQLVGGPRRSRPGRGRSSRLAARLHVGQQLVAAGETVVREWNMQMYEWSPSGRTGS
jgi:hypothetical protein